MLRKVSLFECRCNCSHLYSLRTCYKHLGLICCGDLPGVKQAQYIVGGSVGVYKISLLPLVRIWAALLRGKQAQTVEKGEEKKAAENKGLYWLG